MNFFVRFLGSDVFHAHYYRFLYWWFGRRSSAFNYGYAPLSQETTADGSNIPYQMELYHQVAGQLGAGGLRGKRVLEISCGVGGGLDQLKRRYDMDCAVALDRSPIASSHARRRFGLSALAGDARRLPFADRSFDVIINIEASHLYFGDEFVSELARVLAPGGSVLMADFRACTWVECEVAMSCVFMKMGFEVVTLRDVADNVAVALEADKARRESLMATLPRPFRGMARAWNGSEAHYPELRARRMIYFILAARLPEKLSKAEGRAVAISRTSDDIPYARKSLAARSFSTTPGAEHDPDGVIVSREDAPDGVIVYGPYIHLPPGMYRVCHELTVLKCRKGSTIELDVAVNFGVRMCHKTYCVEQEGVLRAQIDFCHTVHLADGILEFRVSKSGDVVFEHRGATLRRF